jgi:N-acetylmuramoyl-L-alanine amidase
MTRQPICPVVLTENGFMSNETDLTNMLDEVAVQNKAIAIAQGIADYFLEINQ